MAFATPVPGDPLMPVYLPPRAKRGSGTRVDVEVDRVRRMANVLDKYMVDPVIGLILPGAGDIIGSLLGMYTVSIALKRRVHPVVIARMLLNLGIDALLGVVPLLGDVIDIGFKANQRNAALLSDRSHIGGRASAKDWAFVIGAALLFAGTVFLSIYAIVALFRAIF
jgi:hypothetical protein